MLANRQRQGSRDNVAELHRVQVAEGHIHVRSAGSGPLIILLHGWTLDWRIWLPQMTLTEFHLVMPDRRGFGQSTAPPCLEAEHDDIIKISRYFGAANFALIGLSQGAAVAMDAARFYPAQVKALGLIGAPLHHLVPEPEDAPEIDRFAMAKLVRTGRLAEMMRLWSRHPLTQVAPAGQKLLDDILTDYDGRDQLVDQDMLAFSAEDIAAFPMPVLAMAGAQDSKWRQEVARFIGNQAPQGQTEIVPEAGHIANVDAPDAVNHELEHFLNLAYPMEL